MLLLVTIVLLYLILQRIGRNAKRVYIVVLGDVGRSPRMQYHALSFAKAGFDVYVFGYGDSEPNSEVKSNAAIHRVSLRPVPKVFQRLSRLLVFILKVLWQSVDLAVSLLLCWKPSHILIQNPPSLPVMFVCWLVCKLRAIEFVIDWHNYGYTIMSLSVGPRHLLTKIYERFERIFGRFSSHNICVTDAMREDLQKNWNIRAVTMYDRPPLMFRPLNLEEKHRFLHRVKLFKIIANKGHDLDAGSTELTLFTERDVTGMARYRTQRPALIISSTSWTEDEDFSILLSALDIYDKEASIRGEGLPPVVCVITGKGPQKEHYLEIIKSREWSKVTVFTPWLEPDDYPQLLACADFGVCLHRSSSGLDLPMKVIDMFGCGLPVCAIQFKCLGELVRHEENGLVFHTDLELAEQFQRLLLGFPNEHHLLEKLQMNLETFQKERWDDSWKKAVLPIFCPNI